jgi:isovaleryl-CoA dehydrogenase
VVIDHDQREIVEQVERFARTELHPLQPRMDDEEWWPEHVFPLLGIEVNRLYRAGKLLEIGAGTNEIRRIVIARELLAL